jgi:hypothetical protein
MLTMHVGSAVSDSTLLLPATAEIYKDCYGSAVKYMTLLCCHAAADTVYQQQNAMLVYFFAHRQAAILADIVTSPVRTYMIMDAATVSLA